MDERDRNPVSPYIHNLAEGLAAKLLDQHRAGVAEIQVTERRATYERRLNVKLANCTSIAAGNGRQHGETDAAYAERLADAGAPIGHAARALAALTLLDEADAAAAKAEADRQAAHRKAEHDRAVRGVAEGLQRIQAALAAEAAVADAEYPRAMEVLAIAHAGAEARAELADAVSAVNWCRSALGQAPIGMPDMPDAPAGAVALLDAVRAMVTTR